MALQKGFWPVGVSARGEKEREREEASQHTPQEKFKSSREQ